MGVINDALSKIADSRAAIEDQLSQELSRLREKLDNDIDAIRKKADQEISRAREKADQESYRTKERFSPKLMAFNKDIESLLHVAELTGESLTVSIKPLQQQSIIDGKQQRSAQKWAMPIGDAIEKVLKDAGKPLKVSEISDAIQAMGINPDPRSLRSTLSGDYHKRFERLEYGVYQLKDSGSNEASEQVEKPKTITEMVQEIAKEAKVNS